MEALCRLSYSGGRSMIATPAPGSRSSTCDHGGMRRTWVPVLLAAVIGLAPGCGGDRAGSASPAVTARATFSTNGGDVQTGTLEVADSGAERSRGLMGRTGLAADTGMIFVFPGGTSTSFWMKDTLIPLSIAFWNEEGRVLDILEMVPCETEPCPLYSPGTTYTFALEMNAGWFADHGIEIGDRVELVFGTQ
jgi:uncharacterized membrane protein (UPF0127 family)